MHFGELHQLRSANSFLRVINHSTLIMYLIGQWWWSYTKKRKHWELTLCKTNAFPRAAIDWEYLLTEFASLYNTAVSRTDAFSIHVWHVSPCGSSCLQSLAWLCHAYDSYCKFPIVIQAKIDHFEDEHFKLKDVVLTLSSIMHLIDGACQDGLRSEVKGVFDLTLSDHLLSEWGH